jgi:PAS domain S-box-containing protein
LRKVQLRRPETQEERSRIGSAFRTIDDYRSVFDALGEGVSVIEAETGRITGANRQMADMYGFPLEELVGMTWGDLSAGFSPYTPDEANRCMARAARGTPRALEWMARTRTGRLFWVEARLKRMAEGPTGRIVATVHDITDRKQVELELVATKDYLDTVFNSIHDAVFIHDVNGRVVDVNNAMLEMYQTTREDAIGLHIIPDYTTAEGRPDLGSIWKKVLTGKHELLECRGRRPRDGFEFDVEVFLTRLPLQQGDRILATVRNISERKKVERELTATKHYLTTVFNSIHDAVFVHDVYGRVVDVNDKLLQMYHLTREEAVGLSIYPDYTTPEGLPDLEAIWSDVMEGRDALTECRGRRPKDGFEFDAETYLTRLSLPGGDYILANTRDISARKRIERQLRTEEQRSRALSESSPVGMVVIDVAHDFKFEFLNPKFSELFGCTQAEAPGLHAWLARVYPEPGARREATVKWVGRLGAVGLTPDKSFVRKLECGGDGQKFVKFVLVRLQTGEILMTCWDVTGNRLAEQKIRERNLVLEVVNDVMSSVTGSLRLSEILGSLERVFIGKLKIKAGGVFFESEVADGTCGEAWWGVSALRRDEIKAAALACLGEGETVHKGDVTLVRHRATGCCPELEATLKRYGWRSYLCVSLLSRSDTPAVIFLADSRRDAFGDDRLAFYRALGQQIGVAVENARLFERVRQSHAEMKALSLRLVRVQEEELRYVGRELHDEIGQLLAGLGFAIEMALQSTDGRPSHLLKVKSLADTITGLVRELSRKLRPSMLDDLGLLATLPWLFKRFSSHTNVRVVFQHMLVEGERHDHEIETAVYRIVQEALTNVARHAGVDQANVRLWSRDGILGLQVEDKGTGFDVQAAKAGNTNGLNGMRERVVLLGGKFTIETEPGKGTRLMAELPKKIAEGA